MSDIYVMQRANGDVFTLDDNGRFRVPIFNSTRYGFLARVRNLGMLLFKPVKLDSGLLKQLVPTGSAAEVDFWLVSDPFINLNQGRLIEPAQLAVLMGSSSNLKAVLGNADSGETPSMINSEATAVWEDEGGRSSKGA